MLWTTNSPILRSTFWLYIQLLVQCTDTAADRCYSWDGTASRSISTVAPVSSSVGALYQKLHMKSKIAPEDRRICRPKSCTADLKRLIERKSCCILLVAYIIVLVMYGHTNIRSITVHKKESKTTKKTNNLASHALVLPPLCTKYYPRMTY